MSIKSIPSDSLMSPIEERNDSLNSSLIISDASSTTSADTSASPEDLEKIWANNATIPNQVHGCVHDLISEIAKSQPDELAICAWDGDFTYSQLDELSTSVAQAIISQGIIPKSTVPLLFSKSRWTAVAMLAIIKAGCRAVALDATQPDQRLRSIVEQTKPQVIIASPKHHQRALELAGVPVLQLDETFIGSPDSSQSTTSSLQLPKISPSDLVYISFTSGTTGQPKGACISHANVRSAVLYLGAKLGFNKGVRVFDFAPYSFDVAWSNFLNTLCTGGCLCVASEQDMMSDLSAAISKFKASLINITPTVLQTISTIPPSLQTVLLSGEIPFRDNIARWADRVRLLNTYGPTECTFKCAFSVLDLSALKERPDLGTGVAFATWIVDPETGDKLVSDGSVGELYLEGPLVGQGYLSDVDKTNQAFISDPLWLLSGSKSFPGRSGRLYKTGDLFKYKPDGTLLFIGRKDDASQLKIRGQRVEIGDVEHHIRTCLPDNIPIIVDIITPRGTSNRLLGLFVRVEAEDQDGDDIKSTMDGLSDKLREVLPGFMIPTLYYPVNKFPIAATGKSDRRRLREMAGLLTWEELVVAQSTILSTMPYAAPSTATEEQLLLIWAKTLDLDHNHISTTDSFLRLGGDSITAMLVVAAAREVKLSLTVADLFKTPVLRDLAQATTRIEKDETELIEPFDLLSETSDKASVRESAARLCSVQRAAIEDIYPCTPLQQGMLAMTARNQIATQSGTSTPESVNYVSRTAFELPSDIDLDRFGQAWEDVVKRTPIIRTRIVDIPKEGLVQVVVDNVFPLKRYPNLATFLADAKPMGLGTRLCRTGAIQDQAGCCFVVEMHHAIFDRWSNILILDAVEAAYKRAEAQQALGVFQPFIKHILTRSATDSVQFWTDQLSNSEAHVFPSPNYHPEKKLDLDYKIEGLQWPTGITPSSAIRSALTLLLASYTNSDDVIFGATMSGRQAPVAGIERIAGPTISAVPVRVKFDWDNTVEALLDQVQTQSVHLADHEQYGLQNIQSISKDVDDASRFQVLLVVQAAVQGTSERDGGLFSKAKTVVSSGSKEPTLVTKDGKTDSMDIYNSYALMIICQLEAAGITFKVNYDTGAITEEEVFRVSRQFESLLRAMCFQSRRKLRNVTSLTTDDLNQIWHWNGAIPEAPSETVTDLVDQRVETSPDSLAISSWDQQLTYKQLSELTRDLASKLRLQGVTSGSVVVLNFKKSSWLIASMIAVLRAGAVALPTSAACSRQRAEDITRSLQPKMVLVSEPESSPFDGLVPTISVTGLTTSAVEEQAQAQAHQPALSDPALLLFTSGSTGIPKSIQWSHETLSSNIQTAVSSFGITPSSRVFQFAGYEFDVSTVESLATLAAGGCLYVPSEFDRTNRLEDSIRDSGATWLGLTPSVSETLTPKSLPSLKTIVFAGEKLQQKTAARWTPYVEAVYNWYGPAEASVATFHRVKRGNWRNGSIGRSSSNRTWLVEPRNVEALAPVGAVAELCIEGPIVATYAGVGSQLLNELSFISPAWLQTSHREIPGRTGRLYKTGDLVKYDATGEILFLRRKQESQRKLRGMRVDLADIEFHIQQFLTDRLEVTGVAEIFVPSHSDKETLALFLSLPSESSENVASVIKQSLPVDELEEYLASNLPSHMIPKVYIPMAKIPVTHSGKVDRRSLQKLGAEFTYQQLAALQPSRKESRKPAAGMEQELQGLWAEIIGIEKDVICASDNFLRLGGDSIAAMRLVALARHRGLSLSVADVFESPQLENLAKRIKYDDDATDIETILPFSLLGNISDGEARSQASQLCDVSESQIVDVYPCTGLQQGLLALGVKRSGQYVSRSVLGLQDMVDVERLHKAWAATVDKLPILRTRIVDFVEQGLVQVVLNSNPSHAATDLERYLAHDEQPMDLGTELCRAALVGRSFVLTIHHCVYDGNTLKMILNELESQYLGENGMIVTPFQNFIKHLGKIDAEKADEFWKLQLSDVEPAQFPAVPAPYEPQANEQLDHQITLEWPQTGTTASTIIRSAWALLASQHTAASDVIFAATVSGRQANLRGVENCAGPTISTIPLVVSIDQDETIESFLGRTQQQMIETIPHEQHGLQKIQRISGIQEARLLQTLLVVQPLAEGKSLNDDSLLFKARSYASSLGTQGTDPFNTYALMLICELSKSGLTMKLSFDNKVIDNKQMHRLACQFESVIKQLCETRNSTTKISSLQTASEADLGFFWANKSDPPPSPDTCVAPLIASITKKQPASIAIEAWDGKFTYQELDDLSTLICQNLMGHELTKGQVMAIHSEKTKWTPVVQLAGLKAGAVILMQSIAVPEARVAKVFENAGVRIAVVSESRKPVVSKYSHCFTVDQLIERVSSPVSLPVPDMEDSAAILVSSGSTGEPKQILWSQMTLAANVVGYAESTSISSSTRLFQFASYDFDVNTIEVMATLANGGCVCIPSESDRLDGMSTALNMFAANHVNFTPSTAKILNPNDVSSLKTLVLAGEKLGSEDIGKWLGKCHVINWYGPAEASSATFCPADTSDWYSDVIGRADFTSPTHCWIIDPVNPNRLAPFGAVGELALEGPGSAIRYVGNDALSKAKFLENPDFLFTGNPFETPGRNGQIYRTGDLVKYDSDGNLVYIGRKDTQLKIRGQLVAPAEVESHIGNLLETAGVQVAVDAAKLRNSTTISLVAYITAETQTDAEDLTSGLNERLKAVLPSYAIPFCYIAIPSMPMTATCKRDRAQLLEIGSSFEPPRQASVWQEPATTAEKVLRELWATALGLKSENISAHDSFLRLGDSIQAMRLVGIARQQRLLLTVAEIFQYPVLGEMAKHLKDDTDEDVEIDPFSLLTSLEETNRLRQDAATLCGVTEDEIEDLLPGTPLQEGLLALTIKTNGHYTGRNIVQLADSTNLDQFKDAWQKVVSSIPILRTCIIDLAGQGLVQAVLRSQTSWIDAENEDDYLLKERNPPMGLGVPLMRCGLFSVNGSSYFALTLHHSIYDGLTVPLVMECLENFYSGRDSLRYFPFQSFVKYILSQDQEAEAAYWKAQFEGLEGGQFPTLPSSTYQPHTDLTHTHVVRDLVWRDDGITRSTLIRMTYSLLCAQYTNSPDVIFGTVLDGRKAPVRGIERVAGPTIATVPVKVRINNQENIVSHLHAIQEQATGMIPYEQTGLSKIRQFGEDAQQACQFQTMLVVQAEEKSIKDSTLFASASIKQGSTAITPADRYREFNSYALSIICSPDHDQLKLEFSFDSTTIDENSVQLLGHQFDHLLKTLCNQELDQTLICDINMTTNEDLKTIWNWNADTPQSVDRCFHHIFAETAQSYPDVVALTGWDGELTYEQLDQSSTHLAYRLVDLGVKRNMVIPLCFEKSILTIVALFGVMKAGGGIVLLDPALPESRLESIIRQAEPALALASPTYQSKISNLVPFTLVLDAKTDLMPQASSSDLSADGLPYVDPSDILYSVFTSGTTGTPKGCLIEHRNFSSAVVIQRPTLGFSVGARVYDFASYSFDAVHWTMFHTLSSGGTLCVPSDAARKDNLTGSIRDFQTTHIGPTPSLARLIEPDMIPTMRRIYFGGEQVTKDDLARWMPQSTVTIMYGPSECSATTVFWRVPHPVPNKLSRIGDAVGASPWIVDCQSSDRLAPIGSIGELYLEGPLVGRGYLNNKERTQASYLQDPKWLLEGSPDGSVRGRRGKLYKTGDLVKYDPIDGTLLFIGRKDTQVKLRGQRIELGEVEHHAQNCLASNLSVVPTIAAEVATPKVTGRAALIVFVELELSEHPKLQQLTEAIKDKLSRLLPSYMVPAAFIPVEKMPLVVSGKTDRRSLRELGLSISLEQLGGGSDSSTTTPEELSGPQLLLQTMWSNVLGISSDKIRSDSSLLRLGGDSISAMRLAFLARSYDMSLSVQDILKSPRLSDMASLMEPLEQTVEEDEISKFSLLKTPEEKDKYLHYIAAQCNISVSDIQDIFPCTGVQQSLLSMTAKSENSYVARTVLRLKDTTDLGRLQKAWETASETTAPILRYMIVEVPNEGLVQVQLKGPIEISQYDSMDQFLEQDQAKPMGLGTHLTRLAWVNDPQDRQTSSLLLTQHHAIYDGYSMNLLLSEVSNIYAEISDDSPVAPFQSFIKHIMSIDKDEARGFWQSQFADSDAVPFPELPEANYQPKANNTVKLDIKGFEWPDRDETPSTIIRAAWSILNAYYTDSHDVVFGTMVTGRQASLSGIDRMIAPLINAIPVRVKVDRDQSISDLLSDIQKQSIDMINFEQTELLDIRRIDANTERGTRFNTLLVVQPPFPDDYCQQDDSPFQSRFESISGNQGLDDFNPNAVMIMCQLSNSNADGLKLEISFDSNVIEAAQMGHLASQFEHILLQLCSSTTELVRDISAASPQDIQRLWGWNSAVPESITDCIHEMVRKMANLQPDAPAICAWDGDFSYGELDKLSDSLALYLVSLGVNSGDRIPLCFEKSKWYPVAALGAMKAGAACIAMDSTQPETRLRSIVNQVDPVLVLSSSSNESLAKQLSNANVVVLDQDRILEYLTESFNNIALPRSNDSSHLYVVFTSGSTGTPKGIVTTHGNFASAAIHQAEMLCIRQGTRVFDFVSYNFDVSWSNHLQTLICGGCLCIPSEWERKNDIVGAFNRMNCNYSYFTPSVAQSLDPSSMPALKTLAMGGELIRGTEVARWEQTVTTVIGIYGPAECAQALTFAHLTGSSRNGHVGYAYGARTWLVQPGRTDRLAGIGTIGELVIEGPTVSNGYYGDSEKTATAYLDSPCWLTQGADGIPGRSATIYKTGDLLRYNVDGSMDFFGRKDGLIKLRGQRIELAEVEYHVQCSLEADAGLYDGIAAEIIVPQDSNNPILAIFASLNANEKDAAGQGAESQSMRRFEKMEEKLSGRVPIYMVPAVYIHVDKIPMTTTNKTDRKALREIGGKITQSQLAQLQAQTQDTEACAPSTTVEKQLQTLWASILGIEPSTITTTSNFFRIGGESIAAMRLVAAAREQDLSVTVADIFKTPRLSQLAALVASQSEHEEQTQATHEPFSLLSTPNVDGFIHEFVQPILGTDVGVIKDIIPATDFQERAVLDALQDPPGRYPHWIFDLPANVDFVRLEEACYKLVEYYDVLHTVFVEGQGRIWQVLSPNIRPGYTTADATSEDVKTFIDELCEKDLKNSRRLGQLLIDFTTVKHDSGSHKLVLHISHAHFDGYSWGKVLETLSSIYRQDPLSDPPTFTQYMSFNASKKEESAQYWTSRLADSSFPEWSCTGLGSCDNNPGDRLSINQTIPMPDVALNEGTSPATIFHAACAIALSRLFKQEEVIFGRLVIGRSMLPNSLQGVVGPTMTEVPIRATINSTDTLATLALQLQEQFAEDSSHEATGMVEIIRNSTTWSDTANDFGWRTAFQQGDDGEFNFLDSPSSISYYQGPLPARNRPEIYCTPRNGKLELEFEGNRKITSEETVKEFMALLQDILVGN